jgi:hypothetical protein
MPYESMKSMLNALMQNKLQLARDEQQQQYKMQSPEYQQGLLQLQQLQQKQQYADYADKRALQILESGNLMTEEDALINKAIRVGGLEEVENLKSIWLPQARKVQKENPDLNLAGALEIAMKRPEVQLKAEEVSQTTMAATGAKIQAEREGASQIGETEDIVRKTTWDQRALEAEFMSKLRAKESESSGADNRAWLSFQKNRESTWAQIEKNTLLKDNRIATQPEVDEARTAYMKDGVLPSGFRSQILFKAPDGKVPTDKIYNANLNVMKAYLQENWGEIPKKMQDDYGRLWGNDKEKAAIIIAGNEELISQMPADIRDQLRVMNAYQMNVKTGGSAQTQTKSSDVNSSSAIDLSKVKIIKEGVGNTRLNKLIGDLGTYGGLYGEDALNELRKRGIIK